MPPTIPTKSDQVFIPVRRHGVAKPSDEKLAGTTTCNGTAEVQTVLDERSEPGQPPHGPPGSPGRPPPRSTARFIGCLILEQWNLFLMGIMILLAWLFPYVGTTNGAVRAEYTVSWGAVGLIFLIAGLTLSPAALIKGIPHWRAHIACNVLGFLYAPAIMFAFACAGQQARLDFYVLAGLVVTGTTPTGIASNVSCTLNAKGSTELASIEVVIGNVLGTFITPLLAQLFLSSPQWTAAAPGSHGSVTAIYIRMAKQLSATLFAPLIVGLVVQLGFPRPVARIRRVIHLNKVASFLTTLCVWHNFCKAFYSGVFDSTSHATVIYLCFIEFAAFFLLAGAAFLVSRLPGLNTPVVRWWRFSKRDTIALCFCVASKGVAVGAPLVTILFAETSIETQAKLTLALLLYNGEHVALSQMMVPILRWWARDEIARDEQLQREKELEKQEKRGRQDPIGANAKGAGDGKSESENRVVGHQHTRDEEAVVVR